MYFSCSSFSLSLSNNMLTTIMNLSRCRKLISSMSLLTLKNPSLYSSSKPISRFSLFFYFSSKPPIPDSSIIENYLINRHGLSPETALKASTVITRIRTPEKSYTILAFLEQIGFSNTQLEKTIHKLPDLLASDLDNTLKPKINFFQDSAGLTPNDIAEIISCDPLILNRSLNGRLVPSVVVLKRVLGTSMDLSKVLKLSGWFFKYDLEKTMIPNIELLMSCGSSKSQVIKLMCNFPRFFVLKSDFIKDCVNRAKELGHKESSKMFIHAIRVLSSMNKENWELKLDLFRKIGWSEDEILHSFRRAPQVFSVSERKIKEVTGFLFSSGRCDSSMLAQQPELLVYSLETRMKPRIQILDILEQKNFAFGKASLATILKMTDDKFFKTYAAFCQNEIGEPTYTSLRGFIGNKNLVRKA